MTVGAELAQARQKLKLSLKEISARTKIKPNRLRAIEQMDSAELPSFVYLKGFLKAYATEVGLDAADFAQRYIDQANVLPPPSAPTNEERELVASSLAMADRSEAADDGLPDGNKDRDDDKILDDDKTLDGVEPRMTVGAELAHAREKLDLSIEEISARTKIKPERLVAIQQMDSAELPSFVYLKGFLKAYATEVGLDPEDIAQRYIDEADILPPPSAPTEDERELVAATLAEHDDSEAAVDDLPNDDGDLDLEPETVSPVAEKLARPVVPLPSVSNARSLEVDDLEPIAPNESAFFKVVNQPPATPQHDDPTLPRETSFAPMVIAMLLAVLAGVVIAAKTDGIDRLLSMLASDTDVESTEQEHGVEDSPAEPERPAPSDAARAIAPPDGGVTGPATKAAEGSSTRESSPDLSGKWVLTNRVESAGVGAYKNLELGFQLQLQQNGNRVTGIGQKWTENGRDVPAAGRTPISVEGTFDGDRLELKFTELGAQRTSRGTIALDVVDGSTLRGTFKSDAAKARGTSEAKRM